MRSPILLLSVLSLLFPSHATNLIEALQLAGAAQFAAQIQSDPAAAAIFFSNQVQTVFAPVDVLTHSSANSSTGRLRRRQSTAASLQQKLYQSTANTNTLGSMSSESGLAMQSNDKSAAGKRQVFVSNPPRNNKCSNVQRRFFLDPEHDDHYFPPVTLTTTLYITTTATELVTVVSTIHDTESLTVPVPTTVHETELVTVAVTIHDSEFVTLPMPTTVTVQDTTFVTVAKTVTNTESVTVPTTVATTVRDTEFVTRPTTVRQSVTESTTVYDTEFATEPTTMATTVRDTEFVTRPTTVRQSVTESTTVYDTKFATESTTVHETEPITSPTTIRETKSVTESTTVDKTESVTVPTTLLTTMVRTEPTTMVVTEFATASPQIPVTVFTTVSTRVYTTVSTIVATRISTTLLPAVTSSVLEISSGLGNLISIIQGDIPYNGGLIHVVDNYFTLPEGLIDTANANGQTTFTGLVSSNGLARTFDNTPDLTYFIPANSAFAMPGAARAYSSIRDLLLGHAIPNFVGYLPSLTNGSTYKSLAGTTFTVIHDGCDYHVNNAKIILPNVIVGNGVAHVIDKVIEPSSTATAAASPNSAASLWEGSIQHVLMIWSLIISLALGFLI